MPGLPLVPAVLANTQALTVFVSQESPVDIKPAPNGQHWLLREFRLGEPLVMLELATTTSPLKPFPLQAGPVVADYPVWDGGGADDLVEEVMALKRAGTISSYIRPG